MATGSGKSVIIAEIAKQATTLILVNRLPLIKQLKSYLTNAAIYCNAYGTKDIGMVTIASIQSIRGINEIYPFNQIIIDEVHGLEKGHDKIFKLLPNARIIGFTATPFSTRGFIYGEGKLFDSITYSKTINDLQEYLSPVVLKACRKECRLDLSAIEIDRKTLDYKEGQLFDLLKGQVEQQVATALEDLEGRLKVAWLCVNIEHAELVRAELIKVGESASCIHSKSGNYDGILEEFESNNRHLVSVLVVSVGYDYPALDAMVFLRPTRSPVLYVQAIGRLTRKYPGKANALLLDYGKVVEHLGTIYNLQLPFKKKNETLVICPECNAYCTGKLCVCGFQFMGNCTKCLTTYKLVDGHKCAVSTPRFIIPNYVTTLKATSETIKMEGVIIKTSFHRSKSGNNCLKVAISFDDSFLSFDSVIFFYTMVGKSIYYSVADLWKHFGLNLVHKDYTETEIKAIKIDGRYDVTYKTENKYNKIVYCYKAKNEQ